MIRRLVACEGGGWGDLDPREQPTDHRTCACLAQPTTPFPSGALQQRVPYVPLPLTTACCVSRQTDTLPPCLPTACVSTVAAPLQGMRPVSDHCIARAPTVFCPPESCNPTSLIRVYKGWVARGRARSWCQRAAPPPPAPARTPLAFFTRTLLRLQACSPGLGGHCLPNAGQWGSGCSLYRTGPDDQLGGC